VVVIAGIRELMTCVSNTSNRPLPKN